jgi:signal transduction histidine kinase
VVAESERLKRLIGQLLDLSRIAEGEGAITLGPVDLAAVVRDATAAMQQVFAARGAELHAKLDVPAAGVTGDYDRLVQVLINLLGNAAKFTPRGSGRQRFR